jgi:hypothetical protein
VQLSLYICALLIQNPAEPAAEKRAENMKNTIETMREAVENGTAKILTTSIAEELKGKTISTIYFGYRGQDGIDEFVVGEVKNEIYASGKIGPLCLFTSDGRNTFIRAHEVNCSAFTCSDIDRFVYFIEHEN